MTPPMSGPGCGFQRGLCVFRASRSLAEPKRSLSSEAHGDAAVPGAPMAPATPGCRLWPHHRQQNPPLCCAAGGAEGETPLGGTKGSSLVKLAIDSSENKAVGKQAEGIWAPGGAG